MELKEMFPKVELNSKKENSVWVFLYHLGWALSIDLDLFVVLVKWLNYKVNFYKITNLLGNGLNMSDYSVVATVLKIQNGICGV